jgi:hypothetical protein
VAGLALGGLTLSRLQIGRRQGRAPRRHGFGGKRGRADGPRSGAGDKDQKAEKLMRAHYWK